MQPRGTSRRPVALAAALLGCLLLAALPAGAVPGNGNGNGNANGHSNETPAPRADAGPPAAGGRSAKSAPRGRSKKLTRSTDTRQTTASTSSGSRSENSGANENSGGNGNGNANGRSARAAHGRQARGGAVDTPQPQGGRATAGSAGSVPARGRRDRRAGRRERGGARRGERARRPVPRPAIGAVAPAASAAPAPSPPPLAPVERVAERPERRDRDEGGSAVPVVGGVGEAVERIIETAPVPVTAALIVLAMLALALALNALVMGFRARRLSRQRQQLLDEVGLLQAALLPEVPERLGQLISTVAYRPAEGPAAGGDFYDAFAFDAGRVGVIVGDVSGHGRDALARTALMRYTIRAYLDAGLEPRAALKVAGGVLDDDVGSDFATVVVAVYDPAAGTLTYSCAGHPPPIVLGPTGHEPVTVASSPPIGTGATTGLRQTTVSLPPGSVACFYTDGMTEARVGDEFLGRERLAEILVELGPDATAPELLARVAKLADRTPDDMAACILHAESGLPGTVRVEELEVAGADLASGAVERFLRGCGVSVMQLPDVMHTARRVAAEAGSAVLRVRIGEWRPGVDVLPGNVETIAGARRTATRIGQRV